MQAASFLRTSMKLNFTFFSLSVMQIKKFTGTVELHTVLQARTYIVRHTDFKEEVRIKKNF